MATSEQSKRSAGVGALWAAVKGDGVVQAALAVFAVLSLLYFLPFLPAERRAALSEANAPDLIFFFLVLLALLSNVRSAERPEERRFWKLLAAAFGFWTSSVMVQLLLPDVLSPIPFYLLLETFYAAYYVAMVLAVEQEPHGRGTRSYTNPWLTRSAWAAFVLGLFAYFVLLPVVLNWRSYEAVFPSAYLYLVLDAYLLARFWFFYRRAESSQWQTVYLLLAATAGLLLINDLNYSLAGPLGTSRLFGSASGVIWNLQFVTLILAVRYRRLSALAADEPSAQGASREALPVRSREQTLVFSLAFPLIHFAFYGAGVLDPAILSAREGLMCAWLLLMGTVALIQNRLLERGRRHLEEDAALLNAEITWRRRIERERESFIAELEAKNAQIEATNAEMERFATTVSNDLMSPLITIRGLLGSIEEELARGDSSGTQGRLPQLYEAAGRMAQLLDELMELLTASSPRRDRVK